MMLMRDIFRWSILFLYAGARVCALERPKNRIPVLGDWEDGCLMWRSGTANRP